MRLKEGSHINKSLMTLGTVIKKLSEGVESQGGHVPYRDKEVDAKILQPSLGGNANTLQSYILTDAALLKRQKKEIEELRARLSLSNGNLIEQGELEVFLTSSGIWTGTGTKSSSFLWKFGKPEMKHLSLTQHLEAVIRARIPNITSLINKTIDELESEMDHLGRPIALDAREMGNILFSRQSMGAIYECLLGLAFCVRVTPWRRGPALSTSLVTSLSALALFTLLSRKLNQVGPAGLFDATALVRPLLHRSSFIKKLLASEMKAEFLSTVENNRSIEPYIFDHVNISRRALKNISLGDSPRVLFV
ncbi:hypothetical protein IFM89_013034 [Coptis chinensis]|uniref:Kinesin motor domain-containing protein n=1 Tax=Coptis chinensis TaxID=261450 RepID=A0A835GXW7_9MAGN|nr:hypothetical protein IFM89_013034 [Coptis chinensis]